MLFIFISIKTEISCRPIDKACIGLIFTKNHVFLIVTRNCSFPMDSHHTCHYVFVSPFFVTTTIKSPSGTRHEKNHRVIFVANKEANTRVSCSSGSWILRTNRWNAAIVGSACTVLCSQCGSCFCTGARCVFALSSLFSRKLHLHTPSLRHWVLADGDGR